MRTPQEVRHDNAFNFLRILAASAVLYSHSYALLGLEEPIPVPGQTYGSLAVALFFAISGFLVSQSWDRDPALQRFFLRRGLRIFPGLLVVVLLTSLLLGPVFTTAPLPEYFLSGSPWNYIWQGALTLGSPPLLGVFDSNPYPRAPNGSLWTLRYEILMYLFLALFGRIIATARLKWVYPTAAFFLGTVWVIASSSELTPIKVPFLWRLQTEFYVERIAYLGAFFFAGATMYVFRRQMKLSGLVAGMMLIPLLTIDNALVSMVALWIAIPYVAIVFAYKAPAIFRLFNGADYSYGVYIYAYPIQQAVSLIGSQSGFTWIWALIISGSITLLFAGLSWHFIEKPALALKSSIC